MSPFRIPQREGYHEEPLASPNPHEGRLVLTKNTPQRRREIQTIPGAPHKEGTQRATPSRLKASFKSSKCKSTDLPHQVLLEMNLGRTLTKGLNLTHQISLSLKPLVNPSLGGLEGS
jgi:hypothetical protein